MESNHLKSSGKVIQFHPNLDKMATAEDMMGEFWLEEMWGEPDPLKTDIPGYLEKLDAHMAKKGYKRYKS